MNMPGRHRVVGNRPKWPPIYDFDVKALDETKGEHDTRDWKNETKMANSYTATLFLLLLYIVYI